MFRMFAMLIVVFFIAITPAFGQTSNGVFGGTEEDLREFISRFLGVYNQNQSTQVLIGQLPDLPFELSLPAGISAAGSVVRSGPTDISTATTFIEIYLKGLTDPRALLAHFETTFVGDDWQKIHTGSNETTGFSPSVSVYGTFCYQDLTATLSFDAYSDNNGPAWSAIRIQYPADRYACQTQEESSDPIAGLIPSLALPANTIMRTDLGALGYYGPNAFSQSATLISELGLAEVYAAYRDQLSAANWALEAEDIGTLGITSAWRVTGPDGKLWHGLFLLVQSPANASELRALLTLEPVPQG